MPAPSGKSPPDPRQKALRDHKRKWNNTYKEVSQRLKAFKDGLNGRGNAKLNLKPSNIKDPLPTEMGTFLAELSSSFQSLIQDAGSIMAEQAQYSQTRQKKQPKQLKQPASPLPTPPPEDKLVESLSRLGEAYIDMEKDASSRLSRSWTYTKDMFSREGWRRQRSHLLSQSATLLKAMIAFENEVLKVSIDSVYPAISYFRTANFNLEALERAFQGVAEPLLSAKKPEPESEPEKEKPAPQPVVVPQVSPKTKAVSDYPDNFYQMLEGYRQEVNNPGYPDALRHLEALSYGDQNVWESWGKENFPGWKPKHFRKLLDLLKKQKPTQAPTKQPEEQEATQSASPTPTQGQANLPKAEVKRIEKMTRDLHAILNARLLPMAHIANIFFVMQEYLDTGSPTALAKVQKEYGSTIVSIFERAKEQKGSDVASLQEAIDVLKKKADQNYQLIKEAQLVRFLKRQLLKALPFNRSAAPRLEIANLLDQGKAELQGLMNMLERLQGIQTADLEAMSKYIERLGQVFDNIRKPLSVLELFYTERYMSQQRKQLDKGRKQKGKGHPAPDFYDPFLESSLRRKLRRKEPF